MENKTTKKVTAADLKNQYQAAWRKKNPEASKKHMVDYWERKARVLNDEVAKGGQ
jgi:hypothetical protein